MVEWEIHGMELGHCNCAYGCPCQFNALPTHGHCRAIAFARIDRGFFGDTKLDKLNMAFAAIWPGAVHEGKGSYQPILDERADAKQRTALLSILTGEETDDMATAFAVYSAMCDTIYEPIVTTIDMTLDMEARTANCHAPVTGFRIGSARTTAAPTIPLVYYATRILVSGCRKVARSAMAGLYEVS